MMHNLEESNRRLAYELATEKGHVPSNGNGNGHPGTPPASNYGGPGWDLPGLPPAPSPSPGAPDSPAAPPAPAAPVYPGAPAAPVVPAPAISEESYKQAHDAVVAEFGEEGAKVSEALVMALAARIEAQVLNRVQQLVSPRLDYVHRELASHRETMVAEENARFDVALKEKHPDWQQVVSTPEFEQWLMGHRFGRRVYEVVYPQPGSYAGSVDEHAALLDEYKAGNPVYQAQRDQAQEAERRRAAAAASAAPDLRALPPGLPADQPVLYLSRVGAEANKLMNKPTEYVKYMKEVGIAMAEGRVVDDLRTPIGFGAPAMP
jgi:hypothetical protein